MDAVAVEPIAGAEADRDARLGFVLQGFEPPELCVSLDEVFKKRSDQSAD